MQLPKCLFKLVAQTIGMSASEHEALEPVSEVGQARLDALRILMRTAVVLGDAEYETMLARV